MPLARRTRSAAALAGGSLVTGVLAYVVFAVSTRALGPHAAAPVAVLWSAWGFTAAGLTFPIQHWVARTVAAAGGDEGGVRADLGRLAAVVAGLTTLTLVLALLARQPLFGTSGVAFPLLVALVTAGSGLMGLVRGLLTARERFVDVGALLVAENAVRCLLAGILAATGSRSPEAFGWAIAAGYLACLGWPAAWRPRGRPTAGAGVLAFLGGASGGQVLGQVVLVGGPVLLALLGGRPGQVTALFAALALYRAPYTVLVGQVSQLTGGLTRLVVARRHERLRRIGRTITGATLLLGPLGAAFGAVAGPWLVRLVFGPDVPLTAGVSAVLCAGSVVALAGLVLSVLLLAHARSHAVLGSWLVALVPGAVVLLWAPGSRTQDVAWCFLAVEAGAWLALTLAARRANAGSAGVVSAA